MERNHIGTITTSEAVKEWKGIAALTTAIVAVIVLAGVCMGVDAFGLFEYGSFCYGFLFPGVLLSHCL